MHSHIYISPRKDIIINSPSFQESTNVSNCVRNFSKYCFKYLTLYYHFSLKLKF